MKTPFLICLACVFSLILGACKPGKVKQEATAEPEVAPQESRIDYLAEWQAEKVRSAEAMRKFQASCDERERERSLEANRRRNRIAEVESQARLDIAKINAGIPVDDLDAPPPVESAKK